MIKFLYHMFYVTKFSYQWVQVKLAFYFLPAINIWCYLINVTLIPHCIWKIVEEQLVK